MLFRFNISFNYVSTIRFCNIKLNIKHQYLLNKAVVVYIKNNGNIKKKTFANVRGDIIKNKRLTDIGLDAIEAGATLANLIGFD